jgi:ribonuclease BN (tRNA processing enzyme)
MKLTFLGTGGGRVVVTNQLRSTGGFILEMDGKLLHIDPGPGALVRAKQCGIKLRKLDGILISHAHPDHHADAEMVIEAMTDGTRTKRGFLIGNYYTDKSDSDFRQIVSPYHLRYLEKYVVMAPGDQTEAAGLKITATPTKHGDAKGIGFVVKGSKTLGYTSDTEYFEGLENHFKNCDVLVINLLRPKEHSWPTHMNSNQAVELLKKCRPKLAIVQHFGLHVIKSNPEHEAAWIQEQSGVRTIAARDGMVLKLNETEEKILEKWIK